EPHGVAGIEHHADDGLQALWPVGHGTDRRARPVELANSTRHLGVALEEATASGGVECRGCPVDVTATRPRCGGAHGMDVSPGRSRRSLPRPEFADDSGSRTRAWQISERTYPLGVLQASVASSDSVEAFIALITSNRTSHAEFEPPLANRKSPQSTMYVMAREAGSPAVDFWPSRRRGLSSCHDTCRQRFAPSASRRSPRDCTSRSMNATVAITMAMPPPT